MKLYEFMLVCVVGLCVCCFSFMSCWIVSYPDTPQVIIFPTATPIASPEVADICDDEIVPLSECPEEEPVDDAWAFDLSEEEMHLIAQTVYHEGRGESLDCQRYIISVILNRYLTGKYDTIHDIIFEKNQFAVAPLIGTEPDNISVQEDLVLELCQYGSLLPADVLYFRANYYHKGADCVDYTYLDHTYFSSSKQRTAELENQ